MKSLSPEINGRVPYSWILKVLDEGKLKTCKMHKRAYNVLTRSLENPNVLFEKAVVQTK